MSFAYNFDLCNASTGLRSIRVGDLERVQSIQIHQEASKSGCEMYWTHRADVQLEYATNLSPIETMTHIKPGDTLQSRPAATPLRGSASVAAFEL